LYILPHLLYLLQLLDVGCFSVLKQLYRQQIEELIQNRVNHIDKQDFLEVYYTACTETIYQANIHSSFAAVGVVLYDPERVLSKLNTQIQTPTLLLATTIEQGPWVPETPYNTAQLELQSKAIKDYIKHCTKSPPSPTDLALDQLVKGCQIAMNSTVLLAEENRQLRVENQRQKKKRAKRRLYIATGGILTVQEGLGVSQIANTEPESRVAARLRQKTLKPSPTQPQPTPWVGAKMKYPTHPRRG
jgi:hypothetical protein